MTALQSLTATNKALQTTQTRISTGLRVSEAADNAAYWSIATTMRSDNKALSTVQDALGLGASRVDVTYTAMNDSISVIDEIKKNVIAAKQPGLDKAKIQASIGQLIEQLEGIASSATFSGPSWLSIKSDQPGFNAIQQIVASFTRTSDGSISVGTIGIDVTTLAMFDAGPNKFGLLDDHVAEFPATGNAGLQNQAVAAGDGTTAASVTVFADVLNGADPDGITLEGDARIAFNIVRNGANYPVTIDKATVDETLGTNDGVIGTAADMQAVVQAALTKAGLDATKVTVGLSGSAITLTHSGVTTSDTLQVNQAKAYMDGSYTGVGDIDVTNASELDLNEFVYSIDKMLSLVTVAASDLGAVKSRIDLQKDFTASLMDSIERGVGQLVDADMNRESTRLQALQVQQQLGIQALSIANSNAQNILALFKG